MPDGDAAMWRLCEMLEGHAPMSASEACRDVGARVDAALDRLHTAGVGIAAGTNTPRAGRIAAVCGMNVRAFRAALRERAGQCD